jgi:pimeloyl-ACP methyl ester carboxylesterase
MMTQTLKPISYRTFGGGGPKVVLLHGGMQTAQNFRKLAVALAERFTVYVPDRRGRGASDDYAPDQGLATEIHDLDVVLRETGAGNVFGLSSGATIALRAALELPAIERLALYEPPLKFGDVDPVAWLPRFEKELAAGRKAAAFATVHNGTSGRKVPRAMLVPLVQLGLRASPPLADLITTMRYDGRSVARRAGRFPGTPGCPPRRCCSVASAVRRTSRRP